MWCHVSVDVPHSVLSVLLSTTQSLLLFSSVVTRWSQSTMLPVLGRVSTWMSERLQAGKPSRCVTIPAWVGRGTNSSSLCGTGCRPRVADWGGGMSAIYTAVHCSLMQAMDGLVVCYSISLAVANQLPLPSSKIVKLLHLIVENFLA